MFYRKCSVVAGVGLAVTPLILHGHAPPDCNLKIALCAVSDALNLLDDSAGAFRGGATWACGVLGKMP
jgi:hypothetical protein